jgi:biotin carboxyl carrier protein
MKYTAVIGGEPLDIEVTRKESGIIEAEIAGTKYVLDAREVEAGVFSVNWNNQSIEISVVRNGATNGNNYVVSIAGRRIPVELLDARAALRKAAHHGQAGTVELRAPMPGKVVKLLVAEGAAVELNQGLMVIEAMKMQNEIKSPKQGVVRQLGVKEGAALNAGDLLAIVE